VQPLPPELPLASTTFFYDTDIFSDAKQGLQEIVEAVKDA